MQGLPCETYIVALDRMEAVVFFNGFGREREIWEEHTGGRLTSRYIEGECCFTFSRMLLTDGKKGVG